MSIIDSFDQKELDQLEQAYEREVYESAKQIGKDLRLLARFVETLERLAVTQTKLAREGKLTKKQLEQAHHHIRALMEETSKIMNNIALEKNRILREEMEAAQKLMIK